MTIKPGKIFYMILAEPDGKPVMEEWHVRTVRGGKATAIWKLQSTWGKRSTKTGDIGWRDPIPRWCRRTWRLTDKPFGIFSTRRQAIRDALLDAEPDDFDTIEIYNRFCNGLKRMRP